jgi:hypothetical protein
MEYHEIEKLLNSYLEGESTLEEEARLKEYFSQPGLLPEYSEMKELFRFFTAAEKATAPDFNIKDDLINVIEIESRRETRNRFRLLIAWAGSAAAILLILFGIYQYIDKPEATVKDSFKDPKLAYIETKRALMLISNTMNRNTASLKYLAKVDESFNHMKKIAEIDKVVNSVKNR